LEIYSNSTTDSYLVFLEQESNHMSRYTTTIFHRFLKMNMEDGLVVTSCMLLISCTLMLFKFIH